MNVFYQASSSPIDLFVLPASACSESLTLVNSSNSRAVVIEVGTYQYIQVPQSSRFLLETYYHVVKQQSQEEPPGTEESSKSLLLLLLLFTTRNPQYKQTCGSYKEILLLTGFIIFNLMPFLRPTSSKLWDDVEGFDLYYRRVGKAGVNLEQCGSNEKHDISRRDHFGFGRGRFRCKTRTCTGSYSFDRLPHDAGEWRWKFSDTQGIAE